MKSVKHAYIKRKLDLRSLLSQGSYFLLGPRQSGKTSLIRESLKGVKVYNLLLREDFQKLSFNIAAIREELTEEDEIIVIDEVQKLPEILDEVQHLIETKNIHFLLTGSSARKLRRQGVNLLGGRARMIHFHPFVTSELGADFDLLKFANYGMIPSIYFSNDAESDLNAYVGLYLQEEIASEGLARSLPSFARFLEVAATCHGEQIDYTSVSSDAQVPRTTVHEYFKVLKDTLVADELPCWGQTIKRKPVATPKFYFFDWGVARKLQGHGKIQPKSPLFGKAFESLIYQELRAYCDYNGISGLHYWRTKDQHEVDFILNEKIAIEVKSSSNVTARDLAGLIKLSEEKLLKKYYLVYTGDVPKKLDIAPHVEILPYKKFLEELWAGNLANDL